MFIEDNVNYFMSFHKNIICILFDEVGMYSHY